MMKKTLFTLLCIMGLSHGSLAQKCDKQFKKQKNSTSSVFGKNQTTVSKWIRFYNEGAREMFCKFTDMNNTKTLIIQQQTAMNLQFKQPLELGRLIRIALIFDNAKNYIVEFENAQEDLGILLDKYKTSRNSIDISPELSELFQNSLLVSIEIQNPFSSSNRNSDKILSTEAEKSDKIQFVYNCFLERAM